MITYQVESFTECLEELKGLFDEHYQEIGNDPDNIKLNPDYDAYFILEEKGCLHLATVRKDKKLIGYYLSIMVPLLHFKHMINAFNDAVYVQKEHRKGPVGYKLIRFAGRDLASLGVDQITIHTKVKQPFDKVCEKLGMTLTERLYVKTIKRD